MKRSFFPVFRTWDWHPPFMKWYGVESSGHGKRAFDQLAPTDAYRSGCKTLHFHRRHVAIMRAPFSREKAADPFATTRRRLWKPAI